LERKVRRIRTLRLIRPRASVLPLVRANTTNLWTFQFFKVIALLWSSTTYLFEDIRMK
jgi:hypothetical protein